MNKFLLVGNGATNFRKIFFYVQETKSVTVRMTMKNCWILKSEVLWQSWARLFHRCFHSFTLCNERRGNFILKNYIELRTSVRTLNNSFREGVNSPWSWGWSLLLATTPWNLWFYWTWNLKIQEILSSRHSTLTTLPSSIKLWRKKLYNEFDEFFKAVMDLVVKKVFLIFLHAFESSQFSTHDVKGLLKWDQVDHHMIFQLYVIDHFICIYIYQLYIDSYQLYIFTDIA